MERRRQVKNEINPIKKSRHKKLGVSTDGAVICPGGTDRRDKDLAVSEAALLCDALVVVCLLPSLDLKITEGVKDERRAPAPTSLYF